MMRHPIRYWRVRRLLAEYQANGGYLDHTAGTLYTVLYGR